MRAPCKDCGTAARAPRRSRCWPCYVTYRATSIRPGNVPEGWAPAGASARYDQDGTLKGSSIRFAPPKAMLDLRPAQPVQVTFVADASRARPDFERLAVFLPDPQVGFRWTDDGRLQPFHDPDAMDWALDQVAYLGPDYVVHLGDLLDLAPFSRFAREPGFRGTTQPTLDAAHQYLAEAKAVAPEAHHALIAGNHDVRIEREVAKLLPELAAVRAPGSAHAALSVPALLNLDALGVEYVGAYPAGEFWLTPQLRAIHGATVASGSSTAAKLAGETVGAYSTVFGHVHRGEFHTRRIRTSRDEHTTIWAASPGTLARVDGAVPSFHGATDRGAAAYYAEDWAQGIGVARWSESGAPRWEWIPRG
jgi:hypothetical protein